MDLWEKLVIVALCVWGWIFVYKLKGADLTKKILGIEDQEMGKFKKFVTGEKFFKIIFWIVTLGITLVFIVDYIYGKMKFDIY